MTSLPRILLNRDKTAVTPPGYLEVNTETDFLRRAASGERLLIRGERLCAWAETYYRSRNQDYQEWRSLRAELADLLPKAAPDAIQALFDLIQDGDESITLPLRIESLLEHLAPSPLWVQRPSVSHLADWLLWLDSIPANPVLQPLLDGIGERWATEDNIPCSPDLYRQPSQAKARSALAAWLRIQPNTEYDLPEGPFPNTVPDTWIQQALSVWESRIIASQGTAFDDLVIQALPYELKRTAAKAAYNFYKNNPQHLTLNKLYALGEYLDTKALDELRPLVPVPAPGPVPIEPEAVLSWFNEAYLPFRQWQRRTKHAAAYQCVLESARQFAQWYVENYQKALNGSTKQRRWVSFYRLGMLKAELDAETDKSLTLVMVLDGLHIDDSKFLMQKIRERTDRLSEAAEPGMFSALPTLTEFAKEALFHGVPPKFTDQYPELGKSLPQKVNPARHLESDFLGIYLWRGVEPDSTYHKNTFSEHLRAEVEGQLSAEADKIVNVVESVPSHLRLQILITSDHGRMLGKSPRTLPLPVGVNSTHGRVALGKSDRHFNDKAYELEGNVIYLRGDSFGLHEDAAIALNEESFITPSGPNHSLWYPHGGLFPEEVIVPWIMLVRDAKAPTLKLDLIGNGSARQNGQFELEVQSQAGTKVVVEEITVTLSNGGSIHLQPALVVAPHSPETWKQDYRHWPEPSSVRGAEATAQVRLPNGLLFPYPVSVQLNSEDLYVQDDDILSGVF